MSYSRRAVSLPLHFSLLSVSIFIININQDDDDDRLANDISLASRRLGHCPTIFTVMAASHHFPQRRWKMIYLRFRSWDFILVDFVVPWRARRSWKRGLGLRSLSGKNLWSVIFLKVWPWCEFDFSEIIQCGIVFNSVRFSVFGNEGCL